MSVAISSQIMNMADVAIIRSLFCFRKAGKGYRKKLVSWPGDQLPPWDTDEHQNLAQMKAPNIIVGHPTAQLNKAPTFDDGFTGPRNNRTRSIKKNGGCCTLKHDRE